MSKVKVTIDQKAIRSQLLMSDETYSHLQTLQSEALAWAGISPGTAGKGEKADDGYRVWIELGGTAE